MRHFCVIYATRCVPLTRSVHKLQRLDAYEVSQSARLSQSHFSSSDGTLLVNAMIEHNWLWLVAPRKQNNDPPPSTAWHISGTAGDIQCSTSKDDVYRCNDACCRRCDKLIVLKLVIQPSVIQRITTSVRLTKRADAKGGGCTMATIVPA